MIFRAIEMFQEGTVFSSAISSDGSCFELNSDKKNTGTSANKVGRTATFSETAWKPGKPASLAGCLSPAPVSDQRGPMTGVRVLEFTSGVTGPMAAGLMASQGADTVKVELLNKPDPVRTVGPGPDETPAAFATLNCNKRSVAVESSDDLTPLLEWTDIVLIDQFDAPSFGLDPTELAERYPTIVILVLGPALLGELELQASVGIAGSQLDRSGRPSFVQSLLLQKTAALYVATAGTAALAEREISGRGQLVNLGQLSMATHFADPDVHWHQCYDASALMGRESQAVPMNIASTYLCSETSDGGWVFAGAVSDREWKDWTNVFRVDLEALDPRYPGWADGRWSKLSGRWGTPEEVKNVIAVMQAVFKRYTLADLLAIGEATDLVISRVNTPAEALKQPQVLHNGIVTKGEVAKGGGFHVARPPASFSRTPCNTRPRPPPLLGQHSSEVLSAVLSTVA